MKRVAPIALSLLLAACATAPERAAPSRTVVIPKGWESAYDKFHYAPALRVGDTVIVSGIPAMRGNTYEEKIRNLFLDLQNTLEAAGASMDDVVELTSFHAHVKDTESFNAEFERLRPVYDEFFKNGFPAWSAVGTTALLAKDAPVELRAVAVVGSGRNTSIQRDGTNILR